MCAVAMRSLSWVEAPSAVAAVRRLLDLPPMVAHQSAERMRPTGLLGG